MARLGDVFTISSGGTPNKKETSFYEHGTIPWVKTGDLKGKYVPDIIECITEAGLNNSSAKLFPPNTVLIAMYGATIGACSILPYEASTNQACAAFLPCDNVLPEYLFYFLSSKKEQFVKDGVGGAQPNISAGYLKNVEFDIKPIDKQKEVICSLNLVDNLISLRKQQLAKLDELVKSRFVELFGDPNLNNKSWEKGVINDIGTCVAGATPSTQVKKYWENGTIPWMSSGEVNKGRVFETDTKITQLGYDNASTKLVPPKTVVLAMAGQGKTRGTAAITEIELCTNQSICSIVNNEKVNAEYLLHFLKLQYMELRGASTNTDGRGGLNLKIIGNYPIMIPPIELQNQFATFVEQTDKSKLTIQQSLDKLETLKKALMQKYFG
ncbi:MAG: restriction endonuclease subunit S [Oscillospiraceae bacterium]|nr:restriction endonuclease subunit S [Oscillospiraceae bacterium]